MQRLLLDTHVALWWLTGNPRLDHATQELIAESDCSISTASVWEVAIKFKLGKLDIHPTRMLDACRAGSIHLLPITPEQSAATVDLPLLHGDPFDRLLIAQARFEHLRLVTVDRRLAEYGGDILLL
ncbi:MAG: type II toxin-antitoxin system VapC family toxin [Pseudomonadota bacterium]|nr:type II toxin-antitoxin system VapC family toxin [Pseudomonadota bacterium]MDP1904116.1 type II toxin-antitoxin system VapC family toxin [Pseudomonadota bacterium]MDP2351189.1 type II toxin-antitoxin system VapC family toxin [Pseudomonadota bacterium]